MNIRRYFIEDTKTHIIRFNATGKIRFTRSFAEIGIRIDQIRTRSQFDRAFELSFEYESQRNTPNINHIQEYLLDDDFDDEEEFGAPL
jgi:hypothetical protein